MKEYHLSYDVTDSDLYDPTKVKRHIVAHLFKNSVHEIELPVASTIVFRDSEERDLKYWSVFLNDEINNENRKVVYYHLSLTEIVNDKVSRTAFTKYDETPLKSDEASEFEEIIVYISGRMQEVLSPEYVKRDIQQA